MPINYTHQSDFLENATETLRAIAHPIRLAIIDLLAQTDALSVTDIHESLAIEQAIASHHLRILKNKNIVAVERVGKNSMYSITRAEFATIVHLLNDIL